ncbi:hypothetical protein FOCC_FOCC003225 [Frankliniella occidentalis]|uniref:Uncharacterized protein LOC113217791 n=1 Tax=Frankliniella occidentalis TaxID=133901 RepID=A0A6J1TJD0_FRAOC|nr:uncharacterized protein LOC113217791 [Frankliniella occidentalis]KAE8750101.1 hypothetical protein FOCC_FOCC003225 [Frankliniella occidentalis]
MASRVGIAAALLAGLCVCAAIQAPCLRGKRGVTKAEILLDDVACYSNCRNVQPDKFSETCKLCCPTWLGGTGNDVASPAPGEAANTAGTTTAQQGETNKRESTTPSTDPATTPQPTVDATDTASTAAPPTPEA